MADPGGMDRLRKGGLSPFVALVLGLASLPAWMLLWSYPAHHFVPGKLAYGTFCAMVAAAVARALAGLWGGRRPLVSLCALAIAVTSAALFSYLFWP